MDAEFFCLNSHLDSAGHLVRCLTKFVDPTVALKVLNTDAEGRIGRHEIGELYTKLLHASIPPERQLSIVARTESELFQSRIYLRIYWPMLVDDFYLDPRTGYQVKGIHWTRYEAQFHARGRGLEQFLPALAIRDQMVLVPKGQNETLEGMGLNEPPQPPMSRGVIEVDFDDPVDLERACVTLGEGLRDQLRQELQAYQGYQLSDQSDFDTVSALLGVPPSLLRRAIREESDAKELIYNQLRCTMEPSTVVKDVQTRLSLVVENPSEIDLGRLRVRVRGPSSGLEINPDRANITLGANSTARADFSVAATRAGDFVVEVLFLDSDVDAPRDMLPTQQIWITSAPG